MTDTNRLSTSMAENMESGRVCLACGNTNTTTAKQCRHCGRNLDLREEPTGASFVDDNPAVLHVDPTNRFDLDRFDRLDEAELACGFLRANGVACELSSMPLPGLPVDIILWVNADDAKLAWALLADAEREASSWRNNSGRD